MVLNVKGMARRISSWQVLGGLLLLLILARFMIAGKAKVLVNNQSSDGDESAYLALAAFAGPAAVVAPLPAAPLPPEVVTRMSALDRGRSDGRRSVAFG